MTCSLRSLSSTLLLLPLVLACGPKGAGDGEDTSADTSTGDGDGDSGDGDGDGDGVCEGYEDDYGPSIEVTIENTTDQPMYVGLVDPCDMRVLTAASSVGNSIPGLLDCWTCAGALAGNCVCPGPPCFFSAGLKLEPGASFPTTIGATQFAARELPQTCVDTDQCPLTCGQAEPWPDGDYDIGITVSDQVVCDGGGCDCDASGEGWCWIEVDGSLGGTPLPLSAVLTRPDDAPVTITISG